MIIVSLVIQIASNSPTLTWGCDGSHGIYSTTCFHFFVTGIGSVRYMNGSNVMET